jgi:hypothetical protein
LSINESILDEDGAGFFLKIQSDGDVMIQGNHHILDLFILGQRAEEVIDSVLTIMVREVISVKVIGVMIDN